MKAALFLVLVFATGCLSDSGGGGSSPTASPSPARAPGEAYNETVPLRLDRAASAPPMTVPEGWGALTLRVWASNAASCGLVQRESDASSDPEVRFTSPAGAVVSFTIPSGTHCTGPGGEFGGGTRTATAESGSWTVQITGRGEGVSVHLVVAGR